MSMHKKPITAVEEAGLRAHGLDIGTPSQLSDAFRQGIAWGIADIERQLAESQAMAVALRAGLAEAKSWLIDVPTIQKKLRSLIDGPHDDTALCQAIEAAKAEEREARIKAQTELAECREACLKAEHAAQRARGDLANAVTQEREATLSAVKKLRDDALRSPAGGGYAGFACEYRYLLSATLPGPGRYIAYRHYPHLEERGIAPLDHVGAHIVARFVYEDAAVFFCDHYNGMMRLFGTDGIEHFPTFAALLASRGAP